MSVLIPVLRPGEIGELAAEGVRKLCERAVAGRQVASYVDEQPMPWSVLGDGGWDLVGASEADGGGDASLIDLVQVARAWGEFLVPLPLVPTMLAKRWSEAAREHGGPVTVAVGNPSSQDLVRVPYAGVADVAVLRSAEKGVMPHEMTTLDDFTRSVLAGPGEVRTELSDEEVADLTILWAAEATGSSERVLALSVQYANEREQFDRPIGSFQAIKHVLATMKVMTESAETAVLWAALDRGNAMRAAAWAVDTSVTVIEKGMHIHGGLGFTWEMGLHYYLRHALMLRELIVGIST